MSNKKTRSSRIKTFLSVAITLMFIAYLFINRHSILSTLEGIKIQFFALVIVGQILLQLSNSLILRTTLQPLGVNLKKFESFRVTLVSSFVNFFTPVVGGASAKAVYLKSKHNLNFSSFIGALYANYVIMFLVSFIFGLAGVLVSRNVTDSRAGSLALLFFSGGIIGCIFFIIAGHRIVAVMRKLPAKNKLLVGLIKKISLVDEGWNNIRKRPKTIGVVSLWSVMAMISLILIYWASMTSIGIKSNLGSCMIFSALATISLLINLTPGSLGVRETLYASAYKITGINTGEVVAFSLVDRAAQLIVVGAGWLLFGNSVLKESTWTKTKTDK